MIVRDVSISTYGNFIICQVLFINILVGVYEVLVKVLLIFNINSCGRNINLSDDVWGMILIQFDVPSKSLPFIYKLPIW